MSLLQVGFSLIIISLDFIMEAQKSTLQETLDLLEQRVGFFSTQRLSAENILTLQNAYSVRSLSEIVPQLASYQINQTPLHLNLSDIYYGRQAQKNFQNSEVKFLLPAVSQGEDSITQEDVFEPSFKWISNSIIDSSYLTTDKIQPKKVQRGRIPPEWKGINQLLLFNVDRKIHLKKEMTEFEQHMKNRFEKFPWIKIKKIKQLYFKGKPSILLKFVDEISSSFAYFNLATSNQKEIIGQNCQVLRVVENRLKEKLTSQITLIFRKLPLNMTKENLLAIFKKIEPTWLEDLIEIGNFKYTICKVNYLQQAFNIVTAFNLKNIKQAKVNYHPKSAKKWKASQVDYLQTLT